jgi:hypothetical protein
MCVFVCDYFSSRVYRVLFVNLMIISPFTGMQAQFFGPLMKVRLSNTGSVVGPYPFPSTGSTEGGGKGEEQTHGTSTASSGRNNSSGSGSGSGSGTHTRTSSAAAASAPASGPPSGVVLEANGFSGKFPIKGGVMSTISKATSFMSPSATAKVHASAAHGAYFCCVFLLQLFFLFFLPFLHIGWILSFPAAYFHRLLSITTYLLTL